MDYISDMISRSKNSYIKKNFKTIIKNSTICLNILQILYRLGFIKGFAILNKKYIVVYLKYKNNGLSSIKTIKRISKPGNRIYSNVRYLKLNKHLLHNVNFNSGLYIVTTNRGIITHQEMLLYNCGGEIILYIT